MTREEAIEIISRPLNMKLTPEDILEAHKMAIRALQQPEIVRCKDCERFDTRRGCNLIEGLNIAKIDSFCSYAERKEGEAE